MTERSEASVCHFGGDAGEQPTDELGREEVNGEEAVLDIRTLLRGE